MHRLVICNVYNYDDNALLGVIYQGKSCYNIILPKRNFFINGPLKELWFESMKQVY
jgi:hypothetical protein